MSDKTYPKSPFEIRSDLLRLSYDVIQSQQSHFSKLMELQHQYMEQALDMLSDAESSVREEGKKQMEQAKNQWEEMVGNMNKVQVPTLDAIMDTAKKFQEFVSQKS